MRFSRKVTWLHRNFYWTETNCMLLLLVGFLSNPRKLPFYLRLLCAPTAQAICVVKPESSRPRSWKKKTGLNRVNGLCSNTRSLHMQLTIIRYPTFQIIINYTSWIGQYSNAWNLYLGNLHYYVLFLRNCICLHNSVTMTQRSKMSFGMFWNVQGRLNNFCNNYKLTKEWSLKMSKPWCTCFNHSTHNTKIPILLTGLHIFLAFGRGWLDIKTILIAMIPFLS